MEGELTVYEASEDAWAAVEANDGDLLVTLADRVHRVIADTDAENVASWKTLERLGFRREAHFVESLWFKGNWASEYHYAMLDREWEKLKSAA